MLLNPEKKDKTQILGTYTYVAYFSLILICYIIVGYIYF